MTFYFLIFHENGCGYGINQELYLFFIYIAFPGVIFYFCNAVIIFIIMLIMIIILYYDVILLIIVIIMMCVHEYMNVCLYKCECTYVDIYVYMYFFFFSYL